LKSVFNAPSISLFAMASKNPWIISLGSLVLEAAAPNSCLTGSFASFMAAGARFVSRRMKARIAPGKAGFLTVFTMFWCGCTAGSER